MKTSQKYNHIKAAALLLGVAVTSLNVGATPTVYKFGVLSDTQWVTTDDGQNPTAAAASFIKQIDQAFISQNVKLVISVGDLTDYSNTAALQTRSLYAQDLYNAGIAYYPLRGNHEVDYGTNDSAYDVLNLFPQTVNGGSNNKTPLGTFSMASIAASFGDTSYDTQASILAAFVNNPPATATGSPFTVGTNFSYPTAGNTSRGGFGSVATNGGLSYSFDYNNTRFVLLDQFTAKNSTPALSTIPSQRSWIQGVLNPASRPLNAFVFAHKNLLGGNHKDNLIGTNINSSDPGDLSPDGLTGSAQTNAANKLTGFDNFVSDLYNNGVRYYITGHDHHHKHSVINAPVTAGPWIEQIICASDSDKFYTPAAPFSNNETSIDEDLYEIGYYIYTVDGPRISADYYTVPANSTGTTSVSPFLTGNWVKSLTIGYSLNGQTFKVPQGSSYTGITDNTTVAIANAVANQEAPTDYVGTTLAIRFGTNNSTRATHDGRHLTKLVDTGWAPANPGGVTGATVSDIATLWGLSEVASSTNDTISVQVSFPAGSTNVVLGARDPNTGTWYNAVTLDAINATPSFVNGPWTPGAALGSYGVDTVNHVAWAVVNGTARDFAVINNPNAVKGDFDGDGEVTTADLALLVAAVKAHSTNSLYDLNGDGKVNASDEVWLTQHYTHPGGAK